MLALCLLKSVSTTEYATSNCSVACLPISELDQVGRKLRCSEAAAVIMSSRTGTKMAPKRHPRIMYLVLCSVISRTDVSVSVLFYVVSSGVPRQDVSFPISPIKTLFHRTLTDSAD